MFYSQQQEDRILYKKYLNYKNGFFIELGAMDGKTFSNTLFYEKEMQWKGVLIEPSPGQFLQLQSNRPKCYNFNYAVSEINGFVNFTDAKALGCIVNSNSEEHIKLWRLDKVNKIISVPSKPLLEIIQDIHIEQVDLFSIDV